MSTSTRLISGSLEVHEEEEAATKKQTNGQMVNWI